MNELLVKVILDNVDFYANCDDNVLAPDIAVKQLERISASLRKLKPRELREFVSVTASIAQLCERDDSDRADFYRSIPENLGLL
ncbi:hypothetical protein [Stieleria varia]|uniref:Uncharacterized protein n=1 Tax=Stieleria varia TaxID=2528005 RepID=A0A5C6A6D1_9BACT|nr:hypothetical protein [Stieleria varia]TWT94621.1 hypothetical protein Pla52n_54420 [Stieleria varia]